MPRWKIVGGPREYETTREASDIAAGWAWDIQDAVHHLRAVRVEIADSAAARFGFPDAERALRDVHASLGQCSGMTPERLQGLKSSSHLSGFGPRLAERHELASALVPQLQSRRAQPLL
jgi:hypothetical protein